MTNDELELTVEQNNAVYQNTNPYLVRVLTASLSKYLTQHQGMNDINCKGGRYAVIVTVLNIAKLNIAS